jgi:predicted DCC family thiol-disulfide oxidoreductase YuxK
MNIIQKNKNIIIIYDKDCPMCVYFAQFVELRKKVNIILYDMNSNADKVLYYHKKEFDIHQGMIIDIDGVIYHGPMALTILHSLIQSDYRWQKTLLSVIKKRWVAYSIYPILLFIRKIIH